MCRNECHSCWILSKDNENVKNQCIVVLKIHQKFCLETGVIIYLFIFLGSAPPAYDAEYQDPNLMHPDKAPIYENPTYTLPNELGVNNNVYTGPPGKE